MKKLFGDPIPTLATLAVAAAKVFATMPCHGPIYEPEMPEELKK